MKPGQFARYTATLPHAEIHARYIFGESLSQLASAYRIATWTVKKILLQRGVAMRPRGGARERRGNIRHA